MEFGPMHLWESMGFIAKAVVVVLFLQSIYSLYVTIERWLFFKKAKKQSLEFAKQATAALAKDNVQGALDLARKFTASHLARVTRAGLVEFQLDASRGSGGLSGEDLVESGRRAIERETLITYSDFKKGIGNLATIATTAPFVGLFGTVVGIINAFAGMATSGSGGIAAVSAGIAEALVATAIGLLVAIPAAWMFNVFTNMLERFSVEMSNSSSELVDFFIKKHGGSHAVGVRQ
jgi:biopolymer transport protein ExbB/TolQ